MRRPGVEPGSSAWEANMLAVTPPMLPRKISDFRFIYFASRFLFPIDIHVSTFFFCTAAKTNIEATHNHCYRRLVTLKLEKSILASSKLHITENWCKCFMKKKELMDLGKMSVFRIVQKRKMQTIFY